MTWGPPKLEGSNIRRTERTEKKHMECGEKGIIFQTIAPYAVHVSHEKYPDFSEWQIYG